MAILANVYLLTRGAARSSTGPHPGRRRQRRAARAGRAARGRGGQGTRLLRRSRCEARCGRARARLRRRLSRRPHERRDRRRDPRSRGRVRRSRLARARRASFALATRRVPSLRGGSRDRAVVRPVNADYLESKRKRRTDLRVPARVPFQPADARRRLRAGRTALSGREGSLRCGRARPARGREGPAPARAGGQGADVPLPGLRRLLAAGDRLRLPGVAPARRTSATARAAGTREGRCEVYDTECIWSQAYERLKAYGEEESLLEGPVVVKDNALAADERVGEHLPRPRPHGRARAA